MKTSFLFYIILSLSLQGCASLDKLTADYQLVWEDNFEKSGPPNPEYWSFEEGYMRNNELQNYTQDLENVRTENGLLIIEARRKVKEIKKGKHGKTKKEDLYTSASLHTSGKATWQYGYFEMSAKLPKGRGLWPAFWLLAENYSQLPEEQRGEIDIMEHVGFYQNKIIHAVHAGTAGTKSYAYVYKYKTLRSLDTEFHTYGMLWTPEKIQFFIDGQKTFVVTKREFLAKEWPFDRPFHLKVNVAVGGTFGGQRGINEKVFPQKFLIDYIKVYQKK